MADEQEQERIRQILNESFASSVEDVVIDNSDNDEEDIVEEFMEQTDTEQEGEYSEEDMEEDHQHEQIQPRFPCYIVKDRITRWRIHCPPARSVTPIVTDIVTFYNSTKGGVDTLDELCATYDVARNKEDGQWNSHWLYHLKIFNEDLCRKISLLRFVKDGKRLLGLQLKSKKQTISHQELEKGVICVKATAKLSIVASTAESLFAFAMLNIRALWMTSYSATSNVGDKVEDLHFIRALITSICEACITGSNALDSNKLNQYKKLIQRFVDNKEDRELAAITAVHMLMSRLEHPSGLINTIFNNFLDDNLISSDSFLKWRDDKENIENKGVSVYALTSFFAALEEVETDEETS
ncbi:Eukaryotic translation initiation factor 4 gamma [Homalodisca vitripennis]|nr:Eukaryotic translation initiation factor 4 gamma [Homalodisca vitripennis]